MRVEKTNLKDCFIIYDSVLNDSRGYFFESFNQKKFNQQTGLNINFVQDNQSKSTKGVLRGMHFQTGEFSQAKLVRVLEGSVLDIAVDLRNDSPSFGKSFSLELTSTNNKQLFVPRGFAHGFIVLSSTATFFYKCDNFYNKDADGGFIYNDETLQLDWQLPKEELILSEKDKTLPSFNEIKHNLKF